MNPRTRRTAAVVSSVLVLHALALWALQSGLLKRAIDILVPVQVVSDMVQTAAPKAAQAPAPAPARAPQPVAATPVLPPVEVADPSPAAIALPATPATAVANTTPAATPSVTSAAPAAPPAPRVEWPSSNADYLHNPQPEYPRLSKQRGEQGKVVVNVYIGVDGVAQKAEIKVSSSFERLDQAALATVRSWRYIPGKRGGVTEAMWFAVPINFVLE